MLREGPLIVQGGFPGATGAPGARVKNHKNLYCLQGGIVQLFTGTD
jgi:hypothetical protein